MAAKKSKKKGGPGPFDALKALRDELEQTAKKEEARTGAKRAPAPPPPLRKPEPEDEALLLHRLFAGVQPLDRSKGSRVPRQKVESPAAEQHAKRGAEAAQREADAVHEHLRTLVEGRARFEVNDDGRRVEGRRVDLPMDAVRRLRRGLLPIDSRIDLHGMGAREARTQLELFLRTMRSRGERCVLVIHGKGEHSTGGVGILRGEIAAWLSQGGCSEHVAAFATAREDDGGEGAVYVLIRR